LQATPIKYAFTKDYAGVYKVRRMCSVLKVHPTRHRQTTPLLLNALKMVIKRINNTNSKVILHSDQGSQYSSCDYKQFLQQYNIIPSMSRRGNCYDNAVAESFFKTLKRELVRKNIFHTREIASLKIFEYIEMFYNSKRRHSYLNYISPNEFEKRYNENVKNKAVLHSSNNYMSPYEFEEIMLQKEMIG